ncbi:WD40 repeat domain-containing protein, partial [Saccharothrix sp. MB29]|nr:WD40 repeat domain-containing protein [Saccharothrix sp. MB29]
AAVAAAIHGVAKDRLFSEDVRQQRRLVSVLSGLLVLALVAGGVAFWQRGVALEQRDRADAQARVALSRALAAESDVRTATDPQLAAQLALASRAVAGTAESGGALLRRLDENRHILAYLRRGSDQPSTFMHASSGTASRVAISGDGSVVAFAHEGDPEVTMWHVRERREVGRLRTGKPEPEFGMTWNGLSFDRTGSVLVASDGRDLIVWDTADRKVVRTIPGAGVVDDFDLSPDGRWMTHVDSDSDVETVRLWRVDTVEEVVVPTRPVPPSMPMVEFDRDSTYLYVSFPDGIHALRLATASWSSDPVVVPGEGRLHAVAHDARQLFLVGEGVVQRWHETGARLDDVPLAGMTPGTTVDVSADGRTIAATSGTRLWRVDTVEEVVVPTRPVPPSMPMVEFDRDSTYLYVSFPDGIHALRLATASWSSDPVVVPGEGRLHAVAHDARQLFLVGEGVVQRWHETGARLDDVPLAGMTPGTTVDVSADGRTIAATSGTRLWRVDTVEEVVVPTRPVPPSMPMVEFDRDSTYLYVSFPDGIHALRLATASWSSDPVVVPGEGRLHAVAHDARQLFLVGEGVVQRWHETGARLDDVPLAGMTPGTTVDVSADGRTIAATSGTRLWRVDTVEEVVVPTRPVPPSMPMVEFDRDSTYLYVSFPDGIHALRLATASWSSDPVVVPGEGRLHAVAHDARQLFLVGEGVVQRWHETGARLDDVPLAGMTPGTTVDVSADGRTIAATSGTRLWRVDTVEEVVVPTRPVPPSMPMVEFDRDSTYLYVSFPDGIHALRLATASWSSDPVVVPGEGRLHAVAHDARQLFLVGEGVVQRWHETGARLDDVPLAGMTPGTTVDVSADGRTIAATSGTRLWRVDTVEEVVVPTRPVPPSMPMVEFDRDSTYLYVSFPDGIHALRLATASWSSDPVVVPGEGRLHAVAHDARQLFLVGEGVVQRWHETGARLDDVPLAGMTPGTTVDVSADGRTIAATSGTRLWRVDTVEEVVVPTRPVPPSMPMVEFDRDSTYLYVSFPDGIHALRLATASWSSDPVVVPGEGRLHAVAHDARQLFLVGEGVVQRWHETGARLDDVPLAGMTPGTTVDVSADGRTIAATSGTRLWRVDTVEEVVVPTRPVPPSMPMVEFDRDSTYLYVSFPDGIHALRLATASWSSDPVVVPGEGRLHAVAHDARQLFLVGEGVVQRWHETGARLDDVPLAGMTPGTTVDVSADGRTIAATSGTRLWRVDTVEEVVVPTRPVPPSMPMVEFDRDSTYLYVSFPDGIHALRLATASWSSDPVVVPGEGRLHAVAHDARQLFLVGEGVVQRWHETGARLDDVPLAGMTPGTTVDVSADGRTIAATSGTRLWRVDTVEEVVVPTRPVPPSMPMVEFDRDSTYLYVSFPDGIHALRLATASWSSDPVVVPGEGRLHAVAHDARQLFLVGEGVVQRWHETGARLDDVPLAGMTPGTTVDVSADGRTIAATSGTRLWRVDTVEEVVVPTRPVPPSMPMVEFDRDSTYLYVSFPDGIHALRLATASWSSDPVVVPGEGRLHAVAHDARQLFLVGEGVVQRWHETGARLDDVPLAGMTPGTTVDVSADGRTIAATSGTRLWRVDTVEEVVVPTRPVPPSMPMVEFDRDSTYLYVSFPDGIHALRLATASWSSDPVVVPGEGRLHAVAHDARQLFLVGEGVVQRWHETGARLDDVPLAGMTPGTTVDVSADGRTIAATSGTRLWRVDTVEEVVVPTRPVPPSMPMVEFDRDSTYLYVSFPDGIHALRLATASWSSDPVVVPGEGRLHAVAHDARQLFLVGEGVVQRWHETGARLDDVPLAGMTPGTTVDVSADGRTIAATSGTRLWRVDTVEEVVVPTRPVPPSMPMVEFDRDSTYLYVSFPDGIHALRLATASWSSDPVVVPGEGRLHAVAHDARQLFLVGEGVVQRWHETGARLDDVPLAGMTPGTTVDVSADGRTIAATSGTRLWRVDTVEEVVVPTRPVPPSMPMVEFDRDSTYLYVSFPDGIHALRLATASWSSDPVVVPGEGRLHAVAHDARQLFLVGEGVVQRWHETGARLDDVPLAGMTPGTTVDVSADGRTIAATSGTRLWRVDTVEEVVVPTRPVPPSMPMVEFDRDSTYLYVSFPDGIHALRLATASWSSDPVVVPGEGRLHAVAHDARQLFLVGEGVVQRWHETGARLDDVPLAGMTPGTTVDVSADGRTIAATSGTRLWRVDTVEEVVVPTRPVPPSMPMVEFDRDSTYLYVSFPDGIHALRLATASWSSDPVVVPGEGRLHAVAHDARQLFLVGEGVVQRWHETGARLDDVPLAGMTPGTTVDVSADGRTIAATSGTRLWRVDTVEEVVVPTRPVPPSMPMVEFDRDSTYLYVSFPDGIHALRLATASWSSDPVVVPGEGRLHAVAHDARQLFLVGEGVVQRWHETGARLDDVPLAGMTPGTTVDVSADGRTIAATSGTRLWRVDTVEEVVVPTRPVPPSMPMVEFDRDSTYLYVSFPDGIHALRLATASWSSDPVVVPGEGRLHAVAHDARQLFLVGEGVVQRWHETGARLDDVPLAGMTPGTTVDVSADGRTIAATSGTRLWRVDTVEEVVVPTRPVPPSMPMVEFDRDSTYLYVSFPDGIHALRLATASWSSDPVVVPGEGRLHAVAHDARQLFLVGEGVVQRWHETGARLDDVPLAGMTPGTTVDVSADGRTIAATSGTRLWRVDTVEEVVVPTRPVPPSMPMVEFDRDSTYLYVSFPDGIHALRLATASWSSDPVVVPGEGRLHAVAHDARQLFLVGEGVVQRWHETGARLDDVPLAGMTPGTTVDVSADGRTIAATSGTRLWRVDTVEEVVVPTRPVPPSMPMVEFDRDSTYLYVSFPDGIHALRLATASWSSDPVVVPGEGRLHAVAHDARQLFLVGEGVVQRWHETGARLDDVPLAGMTPGTTVDVSADGRTIAATSGTRLWRVDTVEEVVVPTRPVPPSMPMVEFDRDSTYLYVSFPDGIHALRLATASWSSDPVVVPGEGRLHAVAHDARQLFLVGEGVVQRWHETGARLDDVPLAGMTPGTTVDVSADGRTIAATSGTRLWRVDTVEEVVVPTRPVPPSMPMVEFDRDSTYLYVSFPDGIHALRLATASWSSDPVVVPGEGRLHAVAHDARQLFLVGEGVVQRWHETGARLDDVPLAGMTPGTTVDVSADGRTIAATSGTRLWRVDTVEEVVVPTRPVPPSMPMVEFDRDSTYLYVSFPDGIHALRLATASWSSDPVVVPGEGRLHAVAHDARQLFLVGEGVVQRWHETGARLDDVPLAGMTPGTTVDVSADGRTIAATSGTRLWRVDTVEEVVVPTRPVPPSMPMV